MNPHDVVLYPMMTERSIYMIENENKLVFIVNHKANKHDISKAIETLYGVEVESINTLITRKTQKKAFVKLKEGHDASDLAIRLGLL
jgi:large subunit ribosomal protein L23